MRKQNVIHIFLFSLLFAGAIPKEENPSGQQILAQVFKKTKEIKSMVFTMEKKERIDGELVEQTSFIKLERNPLKVYSKQLSPEEGLEVLYVEGEGNKKALINPNGFPWVNLSLDPMGSTMRKKQHHTILDAGFDLVISIMEHLLEKYTDESVSMVKNKGLTTWEGNSCWEIEIKNPHFKYENYVVQEGESVVTIAQKYKLSEYMIVEYNKEVEDYEDVTAGQVIKIPNDYASGISFLIDTERMIPVVMKIYDDQGLYEQYAYSDIQIDTILEPSEFTSDFASYGF